MMQRMWPSYKQRLRETLPICSEKTAFYTPPMVEVVVAAAVAAALDCQQQQALMTLR